MEKINEIYLLLPRQQNLYQNLNIIYEDIGIGLQILGYHVTIYEMSTDGEQLLYLDNIKIIPIKYRNIEKLLNDPALKISVDDINFLRVLNKITQHDKILIWAQYFYGASLLFKQYTKYRIHNNRKLYIPSYFYDFIPKLFWWPSLSFYIKTLRRNKVIAQSVWTSLLLNRALLIPTYDIVYLPINPEMFKNLRYSDNKKIVFYLGDERDTYLVDLIDIISHIDIKDFELISLGSNSLSQSLSEKINVSIKHYSNLSRNEFYSLISECRLSITPVYNGNFEMFPIESIMCGTPVISYTQPYMEVTGTGDSIGTLENHKLAINTIEKILVQGKPYKDIKYRQKLILEKMDVKQSCKKLLKDLEMI